MNGLRPVVIVTVLYTLVVASLLGTLPFWLDEVLQLIGTRPGMTSLEVVRYVPQNPGGVPLGYLVQHSVLQLSGTVNRFTARIPAAIFGIGSVWLISLLARRLGVRRPWVAAALFAVLPVTLRYATEARPYSQAIFLALGSLLTGFRLAEEPGLLRFVLHLVAVAAAVYTQPFTLFVPGAQALWMAWRGLPRPGAWKPVAACVFGAVLLFLPWMAYARGGWSSTIASSQFQFVFTWKTPLMLLREITGAGYAGAFCLLGAALLGWRSPNLSRDAKVLLGLTAGLCFGGGLLADAAFGYFIAIRQFLWALPPLVLLAAEGFSSAARITKVALLAFLLGSSAATSYKHFALPREDWEAAAREVADRIGPSGCFEVVTPDQAVYYEFFQPELAARKCSDAPLMVVAVTPYSTGSSVVKDGYSLATERLVGGTRILFFERR
jgi:mannosyltransferase